MSPKPIRVKPFEQPNPNSLPTHPIRGKIIIAGSPNVDDYELLLAAVRESRIQIDEIVSPSERGANSFGTRYAQENQIPYRPFPICWSAYGKHAAYMRNHDMVEYADAAIVIWEGINRHDTIRHLIRVCCHPGHHIQSEVNPRDRPIPCFVYNAFNHSSSFITPGFLYLLDIPNTPYKPRRKRS